LVFNTPKVWAVAGYSLAVANVEISIAFAATPKLLKMPFVAAGCNPRVGFLQIYQFYRAAAGYSGFLHISDDLQAPESPHLTRTLGIRWARYQPLGSIQGSWPHNHLFQQN
jgi:hypothetical protein